MLAFNCLRNLQYLLRQSRNQRANRRIHFRSGFAVERLENRTLLATVAWDGGAGTFNWNDAANWSDDSLPGVGDDVMIDVAGDVTILHPSGNTFINSLNSHEAIDLTGGSLTLAAQSGVDGAFNNSGVVELQAGELLLRGGGFSSGSFHVGVGAELQFRGTHSLDSTSAVTGAGEVRIANGTTLIAGTYDFLGTTTVSDSSGTLVVAGGNSMKTGALDLNG